MHEYDRWYRSYQRRKRITEAIGTFAIGFAAAIVLLVAFVIFTRLTQ